MPLGCASECTCKKHSMRNSGQFRTVSQAEQVDRFWSYVDKQSVHWLWTGPVNENGYGRFAVKGILDNDHQKMAHVISFVLAGGVLISGYEIDHKCRIRLCVNPNCLEQVPSQVNVQRSRAAKLNQLSIRLIREAYAGGEKQKSIAERFRVHQSQISRIVNERRWSNVS